MNKTEVIHTMLSRLPQGDIKSLARLISLVENEREGYYQLLAGLPYSPIKITGITGAPGAGKSTLTNELIAAWVAKGKKVGVLCVDPSSPFHQGALLGDRIRMSQWYNNHSVYIRSLASRGNQGGVHPHIIEIADLMRAAWFDHIIIETVGVGQSELEIAGIADTTVVVLTPDAGDDIQSMKAGLMEIADVFVVNKADKQGADAFITGLRNALQYNQQYKSRHVPVLKTTALHAEGVIALAETIEQLQETSDKSYTYQLLAGKAFALIQKHKMRHIQKAQLREILEKYSEEDLNLYRFAQQYF